MPSSYAGAYTSSRRYGDSVKKVQKLRKERERYEKSFRGKAEKVLGKIGDVLEEETRQGIAGNLPIFSDISKEAITITPEESKKAQSGQIKDYIDLYKERGNPHPILKGLAANIAFSPSTYLTFGSGNVFKQGAKVFTKEGKAVFGKVLSEEIRNPKRYIELMDEQPALRGGAELARKGGYPTKAADRAMAERLLAVDFAKQNPNLVRNPIRWLGMPVPGRSEEHT